MYAIINTSNNQYFSLLNGGLFTDTPEIAQEFDNEGDAMLFIEQNIDPVFDDAEVVSHPNYPCMGELDEDGNF